jgi:tetratricopeptide (TPR) repeat protein
VESVAWVTERKDVLSGLFFMLTLWAYVCHARDRGTSNSEPETERRSIFSFFGSPWYWLALVLFILGLLSKTMLVTLPFVLLLLDYWPLRRISHDAQCPGFDNRLLRRLVIEKIPFLLLSSAACVATVLIQKEAVLTGVTFPWRVGNALVAYAAYIGQMLYPVELAVLYPHPGNHLSLWKVGLSLLVLLIISAGVLAGMRKHPYLLVGWLWYLGMLVPVIGIIQVGNQARADRYTYLPQIGLYILVIWGAVELCGTRRSGRAVLRAVAGVILIALMAGACVQTGYWKDSISLWTRTLVCTSENPVAQFSYGGALAAQGKWADAIQQYEQALQLKPDYADAHIALGIALVMQGKLDEAIQHYERALQLKPDYVEIRLNLGFALARQGKLDEAIQQYKQVLLLKPDFAEAYINLADTLASQGKLNEAIQSYERALQLNPDYAEGHNNLGIALARQGKLDEAIQHFQGALQLNPNYAEAFNNLGIALAGQGRLNEAIQQFRQGLTLATAQGNTALAESIRTRLSSYQLALPPM